MHWQPQKLTGEARRHRTLAFVRRNHPPFTSACGRLASFRWPAFTSYPYRSEGMEISFYQAFSPFSANLQPALRPVPKSFQTHSCHCFFHTGDDSGTPLMAVMFEDSISSVCSVVYTRQRCSKLKRKKYTFRKNKGAAFFFIFFLSQIMTQPFGGLWRRLACGWCGVGP